MKTGLLLGAAAVLALPAAAIAHEIVHAGHDHEHGTECGHHAVEHDGHVDYLHDGHLHSAHGDHVDEHSVSVTSTNPDSEMLAEHVTHDDHEHMNTEHDHPVVQHGAHFDYVHDGRLHHPHDGHIDDHGPMRVIG